MDWSEQRLGRHLKLRDLNVLLTVARCGSMGKAAAQLAVSQPAISKAISEMEASLRVKLLDRSPRGVEPTIYARALLDRGLNAFDELRQAVQHIEFLADPTAGEVRIGSSLGTAISFVSVVIDRLAKRYPRIHFDLLTGDATLTYRALAERKIDLLIARIFAPVDEEHMQAEVLYEVRDVVAAAAQNPWTRRRRVKLADLVNVPWVLPPTDSLQLSPRRFASAAWRCRARRSLPPPFRFATRCSRAAAFSPSSRTRTCSFPAPVRRSSALPSICRPPRGRSASSP